MATEKIVLLHTRPAAADLSAKQWFAVALNSSENLNVVSEQGAVTHGILQDDPTSGEHATMVMLGISRAIAGGTITEGDRLTADSSSELIKANDEDEHIIGFALSDAVDGDVFKMFVCPQGRGAGSAIATFTQTYVSSGNYSAAGQYTAVKMHSVAGQIIQCATQGEAGIGMLQNAPAASAEAEVCVRGECTFIAGTGGVAAGAALTPETDGEMITASDGEHIWGYAAEAVLAGATGTMMLMPVHLGAVDGVALADGKVWIGSAGGVAAAITPTGDVTISNAGVTAIGVDKVLETMVVDSAGLGGLFPAVKYGLAVYDFSVDGGAQSAITLASNCSIPDNAIVELLNYNVITTCTTAGSDAGTMKVGLVTDGDLSTAVGVDTGTPFDAGAHLATDLTPLLVKTTGARAIVATIATQDFTAGKIVFAFRYWVGQ